MLLADPELNIVRREERDNRGELNWNVARDAKLCSELRQSFSGLELRRLGILGRPTCSRSAVVNRNRTFMIYPFDGFGLAPMQIETREFVILYLNFH